MDHRPRRASRRTHPTVALLAISCACAFDSDGLGTRGDVGLSIGGTDGTGAEEGPGTSSATTSSSTSAGTNPTTSPSTTNPSTTDPTDPSASTTSGGATDEHLQNYIGNTCDVPLWCHYQGDAFDGAGGPYWAQECFVASLSPPFFLEQVHYYIGDAEPELGPFDLEVRKFDGGRPGEVLAWAPLVPGAHAQIGENAIVIDPPFELTSSSFCVGFAAPLPGLASALGVAVDTESNVGGVSFLRVEAAKGCWLEQYTDTTSLSGLSGNWCIDADIRK